jgi:Ca-activated chloride channel homolog
MLKRTTIRSLVILAAVLALVLSNTMVNAQGLLRAAAPSKSSDDVEPIIRSSINLVTIYASVNDRSGRFVGGLKPEDFEIYDNDIPQKIEYFTEEDQPISMGIVFDTSSSMKQIIIESSDVLRTFLKSRNKEDEYFLLTFNTTVQLAQDFTSSADKIVDELLDVSPSGLTVLNDAIFAGVEKVKHGRNSKKALLVISDGQDNNSWYSKQELQNMLKEADLQLYSIYVTNCNPNTKAETYLDREGRQTLKSYADVSGGRAFFPRAMTEFDDVVTTIDKELRHQYSIGFSPSGGLDGRWRRLRVKIKKEREKDDKGSKLAIRSRNGYQASTD